MNTRPWIPLAGTALLVMLTLAGWIWTRGPEASPELSSSGRSSRHRNAPAPRASLVDERPLQTARGFGPLATTPEEQDFQRQAERLANHEVDLAFADALRAVVDHPPALGPEGQEARASRDRAQGTVEADQALIKRLSAQVAAAKEAQKEGLEDQLEVAKAQLELDQDEWEEASEDLEAAGGDPQARIRRLKAAHEAADKAPSATPATEPWGRPAGSLVAKARLWLGLRRKGARLEGARQEAAEQVQGLTQLRMDLAQRVQQGREDRETVKEQARGLSRRGASREAAQEAMGALRRHMGDQRLLADCGKRLQDERELGEVYEAWTDLVQAHERAALHGVLGDLLGILLIGLAVAAGGRLLERRLAPTPEDSQRLGTAKVLAVFALQLAGLLAALWVVFGLPNQATTILGLAGAGLTVAMKDFIVAFFGWFVLMGRNGIRIGDWVEIKGVGGEVIEIGLLRTVLLETGPLGDAAHPTGRRVAFVNSFAIEGHFFNFSTSGQWMWDELRTVLPAGRDPYPIIEGIQKLVAQRTEANAKLAEAEWQRAASRYRIKAFSTVPGLHVVPAGGGIELRARYITRAYESDETRRSLNQAVVDLLQGKGEAPG